MGIRVADGLIEHLEEHSGWARVVLREVDGQVDVLRALGAARRAVLTVEHPEEPDEPFASLAVVRHDGDEPEPELVFDVADIEAYPGTMARIVDAIASALERAGVADALLTSPILGTVRRAGPTTRPTAPASSQQRTAAPAPLHARLSVTASALLVEVEFDAAASELGEGDTSPVVLLETEGLIRSLHFAGIDGVVEARLHLAGPNRAGDVVGLLPPEIEDHLVKVLIGLDALEWDGEQPIRVQLPPYPGRVWRAASNGALTLGPEDIRVPIAFPEGTSEPRVTVDGATAALEVWWQPPPAADETARWSEATRQIRADVLDQMQAASWKLANEASLIEPRSPQFRARGIDLRFQRKDELAAVRITTIEQLVEDEWVPYGFPVAITVWWPLGSTS